MIIQQIKNPHIIQLFSHSLKQINLDDDKKIIHFRIKYLNIDNNSNYNSLLPVVLTPLKKYQYYNDDNNQYFLDFYSELVQKENEDIVINSMRFILQPFVLRLEEEYIKLLMDFNNYFAQIIQKNDKIFDARQVQFINSKNLFDKIILSTQYISNPFEEWRQIELQKTEFINIQEFEISPIQIDITFYRNFQQNKDNSILYGYLNMVIKELSNIDDFQLKLRGFQFYKLYANTNQLKEKIKFQYQQDILANILNFFGSLDILGNPARFYSYIQNGVSDFVYKPYEGLLRGPLHTGAGIIMGTLSLAKNTIAGTLNSINKVTKTVSSRVAILPVDNDYMKNRMILLRKKPQNLISGINQGIQILVFSVQDGVTGLVMQPIINVSQNGLRGLYLGTYSAVTGIIFKPIAGVLDSMDKITDGLKNNTTFFDDKSNTQRLRQQRVFYDRDGYFKSFKYKDSHIQHQLLKKYKNKYSNTKMVDFFVLRNSKKSKYPKFLLFTTDTILIFTEASLNLELEIQLKDLESVMLGSQGIKENQINVICFIVKDTKKKLINYYFENNDKHNLHIQEKALYLKESYLREQSIIQ